MISSFGYWFGIVGGVISSDLTGNRSLSFLSTFLYPFFSFRAKYTHPTMKLAIRRDIKNHENP